MKKIKIILDIIMFVIMLLLIRTNITGLELHEILGVGVLFIFLIHNVLNFPWIKAITKNFNNRNLNFKTKFMYILDWILFILVILNVESGILISQSLFPNFNIGNYEFMVNVHHILGYSLLIAILLHLGLHLNNFIVCVKKVKENKIISMATKIVYFLISITLVLFLLKPNNDENVILQNISNNTEKESQNATTLNSITIEQPMSLDDYLDGFFCTGCGRHCPLNNLACSKGKSYQTVKIQEYNNLYAAE